MPGSVTHVIKQYYRSADFSELAVGTQRDYRRYLTHLDRSVGDRALAAPDSAYMFKIRDKLHHTPVVANPSTAVLRILFRFAMTRRLVAGDPTTGIGKLKGGEGYLRWTGPNIEAFRLTAAL